MPPRSASTTFGFEKTYTGVELIVADGGKGDDEIKFLPGTSDEAVRTVRDRTRIRPISGCTIPTVVSGGPGNDVIKTGDGADLILGDAAVAAGTLGRRRLLPLIAGRDGPDGNDVVNAGGGNDVVKANGGDDRVDGEFGRDTIEGGADDDRARRWPGRRRRARSGRRATRSTAARSSNLPPVPLPHRSTTTTPSSAAPSSDTVSGDFGNDVRFRRRSGRRVHGP